MGKNNKRSARLRDSKIAGIHYSRKFKWLKTCIYCGQPGQCLDHVFPLSRAAKLDWNNPHTSRQLRKVMYLVPSCNNCNAIANSLPFNSIKDKRIFIQKRLQEKYQKKLRTVVWEKEEVEELGPNLQSAVLKMLRDRVILEKRILHPYPPISLDWDIVQSFLIRK